VSIRSLEESVITPSTMAQDGWRYHIGSDEHPLRQFIGLEIFKEHGGVLNVRKSIWVGDYRVVQNLGLQTRQFGKTW
jgi:hypothetical protein